MHLEWKQLYAGRYQAILPQIECNIRRRDEPKSPKWKWGVEGPKGEKCGFSPTLHLAKIACGNFLGVVA